MNVDDVKVQVPKGDRLEQIFIRQLELMNKYQDIDKGLPKIIPVSLHDAKGQIVLKDFAWRITEELGESLEAMLIHSNIPNHYQEEIADALHFLVEFSILAGVEPEQLIFRSCGTVGSDRYRALSLIKDKLSVLFHAGLMDVRLPYIYYDDEDGIMDDKTTLLTSQHAKMSYLVGLFTESLAKTCNTLKNKPWKQSQMMTDEEHFKNNLTEAWIRFSFLCQVGGISEQKLYELYFKKSEVNRFRQRSNY